MAEIAFEELPEYPRIILHIDDDEDDRYLVNQAITSIAHAQAPVNVLMAVRGIGLVQQPYFLEHDCSH